MNTTNQSPTLAGRCSTLPLLHTPPSSRSLYPHPAALAFHQALPCPVSDWDAWSRAASRGHERPFTRGVITQTRLELEGEFWYLCEPREPKCLVHCVLAPRRDKAWKWRRGVSLRRRWVLLRLSKHLLLSTLIHTSMSPEYPVAYALLSLSWYWISVSHTTRGTFFSRGPFTPSSLSMHPAWAEDLKELCHQMTL